MAQNVNYVRAGFLGKFLVRVGMNKTNFTWSKSGSSSLVVSSPPWIMVGSYLRSGFHRFCKEKSPKLADSGTWAVPGILIIWWLRDVMWSYMMWCDVMWNNVMLCGGMRCNAMWVTGYKNHRHTIWSHLYTLGQHKTWTIDIWGGRYLLYCDRRELPKMSVCIRAS